MMDKSIFEDTTTTIVLSDSPGNGELVVDETDRTLLQQCVYNALLNPFESNEPVSIPGDVNGDGIINIADLTALIDYMLSGDGHLKILSLSLIECELRESISQIIIIQVHNYEETIIHIHRHCDFDSWLCPDE